MTTAAEKNHNRHLDLLHDYKIHLIRYINELETIDRESEFAKDWNKTMIKERRKEVHTIDKILKNMIRF